MKSVWEKDMERKNRDAWKRIEKNKKMRDRTIGFVLIAVYWFVIYAILEGIFKTTTLKYWSIILFVAVTLITFKIYILEAGK